MLFLGGKKKQQNCDQGRKHIKKQRHFLLAKVHLVKAMGFPVVVYGYQSWNIKKAEPQRIDAFELWCWRRLFRVPWTARRLNQSILKEISPEYLLEGLMLKLKLQYFGHMVGRNNSLEETLMVERLKAGGEKDDRGWDCWMASPTQWTCVCASSGIGDGQGSLAYCSPCSSKASDRTEWLYWAKLICSLLGLPPNPCPSMPPL